MQKDKMLYLYQIFSLSCLIITQLQSFDTIHFYRPPFFFGEPRFARPTLTTFSLDAASGHAQHFKTHGKPIATNFHIIEAVAQWYQNIHRGLFFHAHLPYRKLMLHHKHHFKKQSFGDIGVALGLTTNYQETEYFDFIDGTIQLGLTFPLSKCSSNSILNIPLGYGTTSFFCQMDGSLGLYDWLTLGIDGTWMLFTTTNNHACHTMPCYNPPLLIQPCSEINNGPIVACGAYIKADHVISGFSCLLGYSYNRHIRSHLTTNAIRLPGFSMQNLHIMLEYDFATSQHPYAPILSFTYNTTFRGNNVFLTSMLGGNATIHIAWNY